MRGNGVSYKRGLSFLMAGLLIVLLLLPTDGVACFWDDEEYVPKGNWRSSGRITVSEPIKNGIILSQESIEYIRTFKLSGIMTTGDLMIKVLGTTTIEYLTVDQAADIDPAEGVVRISITMMMGDPTDDVMSVNDPAEDALKISSTLMLGRSTGGETSVNDPAEGFEIVSGTLTVGDPTGDETSGENPAAGVDSFTGVSGALMLEHPTGGETSGNTFADGTVVVTGTLTVGYRMSNLKSDQNQSAGNVTTTEISGNQVVTVSFTLTPDEEQKFTETATGPTSDELNDNVVDVSLPGPGEMDKNTEVNGEETVDIDLTDSTPVENIGPVSDETAKDTEIDGEQTLTIEIILTPQEQDLPKPDTGPTQGELNDNVDDVNLYGLGDEKGITSISQASDAQKNELLDKLSKLTGEEFNAFIQALSKKLTPDQMTDFTNWLASVYKLDISRATFSLTLPTSFKLYSDWPWPKDVEKPKQGSVEGYSESSKAVVFEISRMAQPTFDQWGTDITASGNWIEDDKKGKAGIEAANKAGFGHRAQTAEEYFADKGLELSDVMYFRSAFGDAYVGIGYSATNAWLCAACDSD